MLLSGVALTPLGVVSSANTWSDQPLWPVDPLYNLQACFMLASLAMVVLVLCFIGHQQTRMFGNVNFTQPAAKECQTHATICRERKLSVFWQAQAAEGWPAVALTDAGATTYTAFASHLQILALKEFGRNNFV